MKPRKVDLIKVTTISLAIAGSAGLLNSSAYAGSIEPTAEDVQKYLRPATVPQPANNKMTPERVDLGKKLFFDPRLSGSNFISCATCHNPAMGWSDGQKTAVGVDMEVLERSTPTILNTAYQRFQFWDGRARTLEQQAVGPVQAAGEMNQPMPSLIKELKTISGYQELFEKAYPGEGISEDTIAKAIASFERTVVSSESPFDRWLKGVDNAIPNDAKKGFVVFKGKANCTACHDGFNFTDDGFHDIGLKNGKDEGRYGIKPIKILKGAFKTPTLRDVALTAPYMHNGQYETLEDVVDHYNKGGVNKEGIDPNMKELGLSRKEKKQLVAFLNSLTGDPVDVSVPVLPTK